MGDHVAEQIAALRDEDWGVREDAAVALGESGDPRGVRPMIEAFRPSRSSSCDIGSGLYRRTSCNGFGKLFARSRFSSSRGCGLDFIFHRGCSSY